MDNRPPGSLKNFLRYVQSLLKVEGWNNAHDVKTLCTYIIDLIEGALYDWYKAQPDRARAHSVYIRHYNAALRADLAAGRTLEELRDLMDNLATWNLTFIRDSSRSTGVQVPRDILRLLEGVERRIQRYQVPTAWDRHRIPPGQTLPRPTPHLYNPGHIVAPNSQHAFPGIGHTLTGPSSMPSPAAMNNPSRSRAQSLTARLRPLSRPTEPQPPVPTRARFNSEIPPSWPHEPTVDLASPPAGGAWYATSFSSSSYRSDSAAPSCWRCPRASESIHSRSYAESALPGLGWRHPLRTLIRGVASQ
ncbi:hypothetical protein EXIGLDRAFT_89103 [Exidia glandulosa HHB12029]|uniref:Uncharacterized protein n=1 Tax=Exidia glandulosa HHB12029 TaxID=1314781 RepID=A0A165NUV0_EXIGL|nr:hypothetical protein EXIGLDRAFT_89103 [Exidia glandulosa HHB12029]